MEVDDAQKQYSEKLVLLPNLSSCYPFPQVHTAVRPKELQIKDPNKVIFLNVHNLQTLLAPHDDLFPQLALKVPNAEFHFIGNQYNGTGKIFFERLQKVFQPRGLDAAKYCKFHPSMPQESFFGLLEYGDVVLDSLDWSGFNTTMEAIGFDKPVVTLPGVTCRSRHSYAILTMLGCPEFIAKTKEEYLQIAAHLSDPAARAQAAQKIRKNKMRIFEDQAPIKALEEFLTKVAGT
jgi:predicted O-linked N-acetylglucosamine transferase (SPINDLY family)